MLLVAIAGITLDPNTQQPVLLLAPAEPHDPEAPRRVLPIWIGRMEASAILIALQGMEPPRPMTHDLLASVINATGHTLERVEITRLEGDTFYAALLIGADERRYAVDARPSDSIALAVRLGSPILVSEEVFERASVEVTEVDEEAEVERFREFLDHVDPGDFMS